MSRSIAPFILATALAAAAVQPAGAAPAFDPARYSSTPTECDRLASHPDDPHKLGPGVSESKVDLPRAIAACEAAVRADPNNPRLNYQLGRVYGYSGQGDRAIPHREKAVAGGYPQALFVIGYITLFGMNKQPQDVCRGGELIRQAAEAGRYAGQVGYARYALQGRFDACPSKPDWRRVAAHLDAARAETKDYYKVMLVELLSEDVRSRLASGR